MRAAIERHIVETRVGERYIEEARVVKRCPVGWMVVGRC
jgi:hypothetical protein